MTENAVKKYSHTSDLMQHCIVFNTISDPNVSDFTCLLTCCDD